MSIWVDGHQVVDQQKGMAVVANSRQYAMRVDPARRADMCDGRLDVVFFPSRHWLGTGLWMLRSRFGRHLRSKSLVYRTAERVRIESHGGEMVYQLDGEAPAASAGSSEAERPATTPMELSIEQQVVPIMLPHKIALPQQPGAISDQSPRPALA